MPKKTKREKLLAEQHRKTLGSVSPAHLSTMVPAYILQPQATHTHRFVEPTDTGQYRAIKIDLVKTLALAATAISVELLLYLKIGR